MRAVTIGLLLGVCVAARAQTIAGPATIEGLKADAGLRFEGRALAPSAMVVPGGAQDESRDLADRAGRIEGLHSEPVIKPRWLPKFVRDVPAWRIVEGPSADKEGFLQRLWRAPASLVIGPLGGMIDNARQWSAVAWSGGDTIGGAIGAVGGALFGLVVGAAVGLAGAAVNAAMAVKNLLSGLF